MRILHPERHLRIPATRSRAQPAAPSRRAAVQAVVVAHFRSWCTLSFAHVSRAVYYWLRSPRAAGVGASPTAWATGMGPQSPLYFRHDPCRHRAPGPLLDTMRPDAVITVARDARRSPKWPALAGERPPRGRPTPPAVTNFVAHSQWIAEPGGPVRCVAAEEVLNDFVAPRHPAGAGDRHRGAGAPRSSRRPVVRGRGAPGARPLARPLPTIVADGGTQGLCSACAARRHPRPLLTMERPMQAVVVARPATSVGGRRISRALAGTSRCGWGASVATCARSWARRTSRHQGGRDDARGRRTRGRGPLLLYGSLPGPGARQRALSPRARASRWWRARGGRCAGSWIERWRSRHGSSAAGLAPAPAPPDAAQQWGLVVEQIGPARPGVTTQFSVLPRQRERSIPRRAHVTPSRADPALGSTAQP